MQDLPHFEVYTIRLLLRADETKPLSPHPFASALIREVSSPTERDIRKTKDTESEAPLSSDEASVTVLLFSHSTDKIKRSNLA